LFQGLVYRRGNTLDHTTGNQEIEPAASGGRLSLSASWDFGKDFGLEMLVGFGRNQRCLAPTAAFWQNGNMAGYWLHPEGNQIVKVATTHDEWLRDRQHIADLGLPSTAYEEIMGYPPTDIDPIRMVGLRHGLVRVREHRRHVSVQYWAEAERAGPVLAAAAAALIAVGIHPDSRLIVDDLLLGNSMAITLGGLQAEMGLGT
jgi:hypothetical protein